MRCVVLDRELYTSAMVGERGGGTDRNFCISRRGLLEAVACSDVGRMFEVLKVDKKGALLINKGNTR